MNYAPILITVYDRIDHIRLCIDSLLSCPEAKNTPLYIASDAAAIDNHSSNIMLVRNYLKKINGFKYVKLIIRDFNLGAIENARLARIHIFKKYDRVIRMEDDVVVGSGFLSFMNQGLEIYKNNPKVIYICGYLPPGIKDINQKPFFLRTMTPYGFGMWRDKESYITENFDKNIISSCFKSVTFFSKYEKINPHCVSALPKIINDGWMPGDIIRGILIVKNNFLALFPPIAISKSIGHDGSGLHSTRNKNLQNQYISNATYIIDGNLALLHEKTIEKYIYSYWRTSNLKIKNYIIYIFAIKFPKFSGFVNTIKKIKNLLFSYK